MSGDTIVALATPPGQSGLAVVRVSGPECREVLRQCLRRNPPPVTHELLGVDAHTSPTLLQQPVINRRQHAGYFYHPVSHEILDSLAFIYLQGPSTSTGEDVLEITPHGNPLLIEGVLRAILAIPEVRLAEPGEFTRRAFENGRIDLVQAEAVAALVHASSQTALRNARRALSGELSKKLASLRDRLLDLSVRFELDVDFAEEEADPDFASWRPRLVTALEDVSGLLLGFERGKGFGHIPRVVLYGAPNAGKSSLINALLREERVLVSDRPGTTRDFVEVTLRLPSGVILLVDTAGLGSAVDALDAAAQARTRTQLGKADIRLYLADGSKPLEPALDLPSDATPVLRLLTHSDHVDFQPHEGWLSISNTLGNGIDHLLEALQNQLFQKDRVDEEVVLTTERQAESLRRAESCLQAALTRLDQAPAVEVIAFEVREAVIALRDLMGEVTADEILTRLFTGFCIGK